MKAAALELPPGFRFHPTDEELVLHYLCRKCASQSIAVPIIAEVDLYKFDPAWPCMERRNGTFLRRGTGKYPNGSRPNRAAGRGYWKATGADKPIGLPKTVGIKKALVFYAGKAPKGEKTNWIMHEYRLAEVDRSVRKKNSLRLDDWVLCRIHNKKGTIERQGQHLSVKKANSTEIVEEDEKKSVVMLPPPPAPSSATGTVNDYVYFDTSDSVPRLHTDSSCSEHVVSPEFTCEVQSNPYNYLDATMDIPFTSQFQGNYQMSPLQDMFMYLQKPF
ncbi:putative proteinC DOMAIN-CONTAINING PROTEIN 2-LIKE [Salix purpurea]|uniref:NAC domain-containing protein n=1 Tax=Salix purpurea TaxID=77065 RepID=A0A9Q1AK04_SALPP|nr:putative proteinC DOMAIN-CONTAINING PROTEIN 2-LIKE [Salix purpurea]